MTTYAARDNLSEAVVSILFAAISSPKHMFEGLPRVSGYRDSMRLMAAYMSLPLLMASMMTGLITAIVIVPVGLAVGIGTSWLWAVWLGWASRRLGHANVSTIDAFQVLAYGAPPLVFAWGPYLGPVMAVWNLWLNWRGLVSHCKLGGWTATLIILAGILGLAVIMLTVVAVMVLWLPENVEMLMELIGLYLESQG